MYKTTELRTEEFWGSICSVPEEYINESYSGEAFEVFLSKCKECGFYISDIEVVDDLSGETFSIYAEDMLSDDQVIYLKELEDKEFAKYTAVEFSERAKKIQGLRNYIAKAS